MACKPSSYSGTTVDRASTHHILPAVLSLLFAAISVFGPNGYIYGNLDHEIFVPFVKNILHPHLYPSDLLVEQQPYIYTFLWLLIANLTRFTGFDLPVIFFAVYFLTLAALFRATYALAYTLFRRIDVAILSLFFLLFYRGHLAGTPPVETLLLPRFAALPFVLFAFSSFLRRNYARAYALLGLAFLFHAILAGLALLMCTVAMFGLHKRDLRKLLTAHVVFLLFASPVVIWMMMHRVPSAGVLPDQTWLNILRLRIAHHHFPLSWEPINFLQAAFRLAVFFIAWRRAPSRDQHDAVKFFTYTALTLMGIGIVFTEWLPVTLVIQMQFFRGFALIVFFILVYYANFVVAELSFGTSVWRGLAAALLSVLLFFNFVAPARPAFSNWLFLSVIAFALLIPAYQRITRKPASSLFVAVAVIIMALALGIGKGAGLASFTMQPNVPADWRELQQWARAQTDPSAIFIVPPMNKGFRVESERSVYIDWKDGGLAFANPAFAEKWLDRLKQLGYQPGQEDPNEGYRALPPERFAQIASEFPDTPVYLITEANDPADEFPIAHKTNAYNVYKIKE